MIYSNMNQELAADDMEENSLSAHKTFGSRRTIPIYQNIITRAPRNLRITRTRRDTSEHLHHEALCVKAYLGVI